MDFMEVFLAYLEGKMSASAAEEKIEKMLPILRSAGRDREYARALLCGTYLKRYHQYNTGRIKPKDLVLFIRDFVLFMGRFHFPRLITDVVERDGDSLGVFVAMDGAVDAIEKYPQSMEENRQFIREVYRLGKEEENSSQESSGDDYVRRYTRFLSYRSLEQKIAVHSALDLPDNHTLMISLLTGGGKSLISQLLAASEERLTIVVVPTVSLAKDQYIQARECLADENVTKNIYCYRGASDNHELIAGVKARTARLIFTSPEGVIKNAEFNLALRNAAREQFLHNVVIDEAHMVPDWGVKFRPDFQIFSVVLKELRLLAGYNIRTYLLSATLSDDVVDVLFDLFGSEGRNVQFRCDALRREPRYLIVDNHNFDRRENGIIEMVKYLPKPLIVYVIEPATAERYWSMLQSQGFSNMRTYTGETGDAEREVLLEQWKKNDFDVMIATSAFGMGVDKNNVRTVIHACVPENLSRFYQEVGRAGRDGLPSLSVLSHYIRQYDDRNDLTVAFGLVNKSILKKENLLIRLFSILEDRKTDTDGDVVTADLNTVPTSFTEEEAAHAGMRNMCWNANTLLLLHRQGYIDIEKAVYDAKDRTYLFTFRIRDIDLLRNKKQLSESLADDRQQEYEMREEGYRKMTELIRKPRAKCWAKQFVSLYPFAQPICSGCPVHPEGSSVKEDTIRIRRNSAADVMPDAPGRLLRRYMGVLNNMLIPIEDYDEMDIRVVAEKTDKLGLACLVYPDSYGTGFSAGCMTLRHTEFLVVAEKVPWVFRNGLMIVLCDENSISNEVFEAANRGKVAEYRKVWCCKPDTRIVAKNRAVNEFLDGHSYLLNSI